ncbi:hypothetical protein BS50DRAFT_571859 [Corynespora cassiicola Philippines]|uniref:Uncharacterized protein n=1 Tax=Corynespora cassiicola Philippines TaxID=1448308 RepID=A0A2T2NTC1_CORCC|nr:hypothetical protein BS50DRAFT_571859 [Corynespora cassiicola Philippines]
MNYPEFNGFCFISFALISNNFPVPSPFFAATDTMNQASYSPSEFESSPNFETVLHAIESKMGHDWDLYRECVEGTVLAYVRQEDVSAWSVAFDRLLQAHPSIELDHEGVLFLLKEEFGIHVTKVQQGKPIGMRILYPYPMNWLIDRSDRFFGRSPWHHVNTNGEQGIGNG